MDEKSKKEPVLCYVSLPWLFFTTQDLTKQTGDDWNDIPYEHNAEEPYYPRPEKGETWEIIKVAVDTDLVTPDYGMTNCPFSVDMINSGVSPWLRTPFSTKPFVMIPAGSRMRDVISIIKSRGGKVYKEV